ncbi:hypothetical protein [Streptomyces sp. NPDC020747]|uniref:hypothetical protein n=1 Tax=Streptomyces sp. NPDC020747 TaxID=3365086 RepID=UPI0037937917
MATQLSQQLQGFLNQWQTRQRRTAGLQAALFVRLDALRRTHHSWGDYDLITVLLGALHLVIENDRLSGGRPRHALLDDVTSLCAWQQPQDPPTTHREIAEAVMDLLVNERERQTRMTDRYVRPDENAHAHYVVQSFAFVTTAADDESSEPVLRATPEAINVFQNLVDFDPFDRLSAERYRSERMLKRRDYDEVLDSIDRRTLSVHGLSAQLTTLLRRITYNVRDIDYASDVMPRLTDIITLVGEQVEAEEKFADAVAEHLHLHAPDYTRLQRLSSNLRDLIVALLKLQHTGAEVRTAYEAEQDRQLFTPRRLTINPQGQLFAPLLDMPAQHAADLLEPLMARLLGPRAPRVLSLPRLQDVMTPAVRRPTEQYRDPFDIGSLRIKTDDLDPAVLAAVHDILDNITAPTRLSALLQELQHSGALDTLSAPTARFVPWALAVTVTSAYGGLHSEDDDLPSATDAFITGRLTVVRPGTPLPAGAISGDELVLIPRPNEADNLALHLPGQKGTPWTERMPDA